MHEMQAPRTAALVLSFAALTSTACAPDPVASVHVVETEFGPITVPKVRDTSASTSNSNAFSLNKGAFGVFLLVVGPTDGAAGKWADETSYSVGEGDAYDISEAYEAGGRTVFISHSPGLFEAHELARLRGSILAVLLEPGTRTDLSIRYGGALFVGSPPAEPAAP